MRVFAPGKLVLTGAYAVLEGAPAIVVATSRGAFAHRGVEGGPATPEVRAALGDAPAPIVDASDMFVGSRKLGLGASAAILVASLGVCELEKGSDLSAPSVREALFARARAAHAKAQSGGSGVDVAASVHGGALRYTLEGHVPVALPPGTNVSVLACTESARTSELRAVVDRLARTDARLHRSCMDDLGTIAVEAARAAERGDRAAFVDAVARAARALARLGAASGAPIVPPGFDELEEIALAEHAAFCVAGAGGGDVAAFVGGAGPSARFLERARGHGLTLLDVQLDAGGLRGAGRLEGSS